MYKRASKTYQIALALYGILSLRTFQCPFLRFPMDAGSLSEYEVGCKLCSIMFVFLAGGSTSRKARLY